MTDRDKLIERARALSELDEGLIGEAMGERPRRRLGLRAAAAAAAALLITGLALILSLYHGGRKNAKEVSIATELPYATHEASVTEPPATPMPLPSEAPTEGPAASAAPASSAAPTDKPSPKATGKPKTCVFASEDEFIAAVRGADEADKLLYGIDRYFVPAAVPEDAELDGIKVSANAIAFSYGSGKYEFAWLRGQEPEEYFGTLDKLYHGSRQGEFYIAESDHIKVFREQYGCVFFAGLPSGSDTELIESFCSAVEKGV